MIDIFVGLFIALIGVIVDGIFITIISILKFPCAIVRICIYIYNHTLIYFNNNVDIELWKKYFDASGQLMLACFIFFILGNVLVPAVAVIGLAVVIIGILFYIFFYKIFNFV